MQNRLFSLLNNNVFLFESPKHIKTYYDIFPKIMVCSHFTLRIKFISLSSNFRKITIYCEIDYFHRAVKIMPFSHNKFGNTLMYNV